MKKSPASYGGDLLKTRRGRAHGRPLSTQNTMHLVLRSSLANRQWSFRRRANDRQVRAIIARFAARYGVTIKRLTNAGNHLHLHLKLTKRQTYKAFIKAVTGAIAMAITGASRWKTLKQAIAETYFKGELRDLYRKGVLRFWDRRPFTRIVYGFQGLSSMRDYLNLNELEMTGYTRAQARAIIASSSTGPPRA
ncbi:MAG TPA: transposase [Bdellovibrionales bacterium]|nr:transposase [Bdellovibrionales bacterium]